MADTPALFADLNQEPTAPEPHGFRYQDEIITPEEEAALAASLAQLDLKPFEFHGHLGNRRIITFGLNYNYDRRSVEPAPGIPGFLSSLRLKAAQFAGCDPEDFPHAGINEYRPGAGIGWHKDKPQFGIVAGISILSPAVMRFRKPDGPRWLRVSRLLKPRSIYLLTGDARSAWEHSITPHESLRYSINFRTLADTPTPRSPTGTATKASLN
jgi:alkylated DNA repair dioxygenase AlkB